jgi:hypothetical protein
MTLVLSGNTGSALDGIKNSLMFLETAKATTSGTSIDFTGIPSWAKKITVMFNGVSTNGTSKVQIQLGTSGGFQTTNYFGAASNVYSAAISSNLSSGFTTEANTAANIRHGIIQLSLLDSTTGLWTAFGIQGLSDAAGTFPIAGSKTLSGTLDRLRLTTVNGTDTFDAGSINILIEGYV